MGVSCVFNGTMVNVMALVAGSISAESKAATAHTKPLITPRARGRPDRTESQPHPAGLRVMSRHWSRWHTFLLGNVDILTLRHS